MPVQLINLSDHYCFHLSVFITECNFLIEVNLINCLVNSHC